MKSDTSGDLDLGLSLEALVLYSVAPGCKLFCLLLFVPEFFSLPSLSLSCFSVQVGASLWVGQGWSSS